jgi:hypothetical protein
VQICSNNSTTKIRIFSIWNTKDPSAANITELTSEIKCWKPLTAVGVFVWQLLLFKDNIDQKQIYKRDKMTPQKNEEKKIPALQHCSNTY